jgi:8-oxo-dGTP pyrophosphatase MutT (NUDIX family)
MVVKNKDKYLVMKRKKDWIGWEGVKGGIEKNESKIQAVKRELKEETGLKPIKIIDMKISKKFKYPKNFKGWPGYNGMSWHLYAVQVNSKKVKIDNYEHSGYKWLEFEKAHKLLTYSLQKQAFRLVNDRFNK